MVILFSNPIGFVATPMVAQPYFEFKCDNNMRIQLQQAVAYDKYKKKAKYMQKTR